MSSKNNNLTAKTLTKASQNLSREAPKPKPGPGPGGDDALKISNKAQKENPIIRKGK